MFCQRKLHKTGRARGAGMGAAKWRRSGGRAREAVWGETRVEAREAMGRTVRRWAAAAWHCPPRWLQKPRGGREGSVTHAGGDRRANCPHRRRPVTAHCSPLRVAARPPPSADCQRSFAACALSSRMWQSSSRWLLPLHRSTAGFFLHTDFFFCVFS
jgi:hypothetical protein